MIPQPVARPRLLPVMAERPKCSSSYLFIWDAMELVGRAVNAGRIPGQRGGVKAGQ